AAAADDADRTADELVAVRAVDPFFDDGSRGLRDAARAAAAVRAAALAAGDGGGDGADHRADRRDDAGAGDRAAALALAVLVVADRGGRAAEDRELPRRTARDVAAGENLAARRVHRLHDGRRAARHHRRVAGGAGRRHRAGRIR